MVNNVLQMSIKFGLQPLLLCATLILWSCNQNELWIYPVLAIGIQLILGTLESVSYTHLRAHETV